MDSRNPSNPSKPNRGRKTATASKARKQPRKTAELPDYNVGQVHLLLDLMNEFARHLEAPAFDKDGDLEVTLASDMVGLEAFMQFKLETLRRQQETLEALWEL